MAMPPPSACMRASRRVRRARNEVVSRAASEGAFMAAIMSCALVVFCFDVEMTVRFGESFRGDDVETVAGVQRTNDATGSHRAAQQRGEARGLAGGKVGEQRRVVGTQTGEGVAWAVHILYAPVVAEHEVALRMVDGIGHEQQVGEVAVGGEACGGRC